MGRKSIAIAMGLTEGQLRLTNQIRRLRLDAGAMIQQQMADAVGVTRPTMIAIEADKYSPSPNLACPHCPSLKQPLEQVFRYQESGKR